MRLPLLAALCATLSAIPGYAAVYIADLTTFSHGTIDQRTNGITNGPNACGPTSTVNALLYLQSRYGFALVPHIGSNTAAQDATAAINSVGVLMGLPANGNGGVLDQNFANGMRQYIQNAGMSDQIAISVQGDAITAATVGNYTAAQTIPTWQFLYDQLQRGQGVEVGFNWGNGGQGGHWVTATGLYFDDSNNNLVIDSGELAQMSFVDPWGGVAIPTFQTSLSMGAAGNSSGHLVLTYAGGAAGDASDPENPSGGTSGYIDIIVAQGPIPEPATLSLLALGSVGLMLRRRTPVHPATSARDLSRCAAA